MAKRDFKLQMLESFSGGLNLRADQFDLKTDESPDMLNVNVDPRGGVALRGGIIRRNATALANDVKGIWGFYTDGGTQQVMVNHGQKVAYSASGNFFVSYHREMTACVFFYIFFVKSLFIVLYCFNYFSYLFC